MKNKIIEKIAHKLKISPETLFKVNGIRCEVLQHATHERLFMNPDHCSLIFLMVQERVIVTRNLIWVAPYFHQQSYCVYPFP